MKLITRASIRKIIMADDMILRFFPMKKRKNIVVASVLKILKIVFIGKLTHL